MSDHNKTESEKDSELLVWVRNHFYRINIYFPSFAINEVEQKPMTERADLLSSVGGVFGLWAGISLLSAMEIMEFVAKVYGAILFRNK